MYPTCVPSKLCEFINLDYIDNLLNGHEEKETFRFAPKQKTQVTPASCNVLSPELFSVDCSDEGRDVSDLSLQFLLKTLDGAFVV